MIPVPIPTETARAVFDACVDGVRDQTLRANLTGVSRTVEAAEGDYRAAAAEGSLHQYPSVMEVGPGVSEVEMSWVYRERLVRKNTTRRSIYDKLLISAPLGICPLCSQRTVSTLDHYLPVSSYPVLAVTPVNLVPACLDCNKEKLDRVPGEQAELTLHPYFDDYSAETWLHGRVNEVNPASVSFFVRAPASWEEIVAARLQNHFNVFRLAALYASNSAVELVNIRQSLRRLFHAGGQSAVHEHIAREADSREHNQRNTWQSALYRALAQSDWFCAGGFR